MERIRVELRSSGGFGGLLLAPIVLDTAELAPERVQELATLVDALAGVQPLREPPARVPDSTRYELTIMRGGRVRRLSFDDTTVPAEVRPLLDYLTRHSRGG